MSIYIVFDNVDTAEIPHSKRIMIVCLLRQIHPKIIECIYIQLPMYLLHCYLGRQYRLRGMSQEINNQRFHISFLNPFKNILQNVDKIDETKLDECY